MGNEINRIISEFIGIALVIFILAVTFACGYQYALYTSIDLPIEKEINYDKDIIENSIVYNIAKNLLSESRYIVTDWDCSNQTSEIVRRSRIQGYNADYMDVMMKVNNTYFCHTIVNYTGYIEATSGTHIDPKDIGPGRKYIINTNDNTTCKNEDDSLRVD
ncbi:MAG: hypothetical protein KAK00_00295 [Nanoarchaeota archaeon]|nr:hypothetical protein [Nanoarchaeota archaeon]